VNIGDIVKYIGVSKQMDKFGIVIGKRHTVPSYNYVIRGKEKGMIYRICFPKYTGWFKPIHIVVEIPLKDDNETG
jgi:hypothetical protein